jgi:hypothetical protein
MCITLHRLQNSSTRSRSSRPPPSSFASGCSGHCLHCFKLLLLFYQYTSCSRYGSGLLLERRKHPCVQIITMRGDLGLRPAFPPQDRGDAHGHAIKAFPGVLAIVWYLLTPTFSNWARFPARLVRLHVRFQIDVHRTESGVAVDNPLVKRALWTVACRFELQSAALIAWITVRYE